MQKSVAILALLMSFAAAAQQLTPADFKHLQKLEDTLSVPAKTMIFDREASKRFAADSVFIRLFVRALKVPNSFEYPFDSIITVSKLMAPDSSFRIFTWQFEKDESYYRQRGAIQMRTKDGTLKLFPLIDMSDFTKNPVDSVRSNLNWIGAIYYNIVEKSFKNKNYYTLLGYDDNSLESTKKWLEVLTFDDNNNPQFGGRYFNYVKRYHQTRPARLPFLFRIQERCKSQDELRQ